MSSNEAHPNWERMLRIVQLRSEGKTLAEIGAMFDLSGNRIRGILKEYERRKLIDQSWHKGLKQSTVNSLIHEGIYSRDALHKAYIENRLIKGSMRRIGTKALEEIHQWLGVEMRPDIRPLPKPAAIDAAIRLLERAGYKVSR